MRNRRSTHLGLDIGQVGKSTGVDRGLQALGGGNVHRAAMTQFQTCEYKVHQRPARRPSHVTIGWVGVEKADELGLDSLGNDTGHLDLMGG